MNKTAERIGDVAKEVARTVVMENCPHEASRFDSIWTFLKAADDRFSSRFPGTPPQFLELPLAKDIISPIIVGIVIGLVPIIYDVWRDKPRRDRRNKKKKAQTMIAQHRQVVRYTKRIKTQVRQLKSPLAVEQVIERTIRKTIEILEDEEGRITSDNSRKE